MQNFTGQIFGKLTVLGELEPKVYPSGAKHRVMLVECSCEGKTQKTVNLNSLKTGHSTSCGCAQKEAAVKSNKSRKTHGSTLTPTYYSWKSMKARCLNKNHTAYKNYGGRGIAVCEEWLGDSGFETFLEEMGERPEGASLDRKDNDKGYSKDNCKWSSALEQSYNRRSNHMITYNGVTKPLGVWAEDIGISYNALALRVTQYKWPIAQALGFEPRG